ncbi:MAG TPA: DEAD/DEAH box helicase [Cytophagaceae bacterium]
MKVSTAQPFQLIYSLLQHEYLGYLFEAFIVQLDSNGRLTLKHQQISSKIAEEFASNLDENDFKILKLIDSIQQDSIVKRFYNKKVTATEFFLKVYHKDKGDTLLQEAIATHIEDRKAEILRLLDNKMIFEMGSDGEPTWKQIFIQPRKATILFHFMRNETDTHYFPTIKYDGEKVDFQYKNAIVVCNSPGWLLVETKLYNFEKEVDGNKLKPFLNKKFILIPKKVEDTYFDKFVTPLVAAFDVHAKGFKIFEEQYNPFPVLTFSELVSNQTALNLFGDKNVDTDIMVKAESRIVFSLCFQYGQFLFSSDNKAPSYAKLEKNNGDYIFHKVKRHIEWERDIFNHILTLGINLKNGKALLEKFDAFTWLEDYSSQLMEQGFIIKQQIKDGKKYFIGSTSFSLEVKENNDWFDIYATIKFGEFEIPFLQLRNLILKRRSEFTLPNGEIAVIPKVWFTRYAELFAFIENEEKSLQLKKHHIALVQELQKQSYASVTLSGKLEQLKDFEEIEDCALPLSFNGELRPYQKAGYNWMQFLNKFSFGGCLADDMGLGKTVQTLALLQDQKDKGALNASLLMMPTSLIYNWEMEAKKFTPALKIFNYTGTGRIKNPELFHGYDLVLTSYGTTRVDIEYLKQYYFNYIILDESQAIKNPDSNIAKAVLNLKCKHRLILTGTPIENSTLDLWSQMNFINPGLLGTESFFKNEFLYAIEKKHDELKTKRLYSIIKPFILRRKKSQVATELPEKIENVKYCKMTVKQEEEYEKVRSSYRNEILRSVAEKGVGGSQILLLQGLTKLRQIANHPQMTVDGYDGDSGKMEDVVHMLQNAITNNHKILIFSQFVKHLSIFRKYVDDHCIKYAYLDGSTKDRQGQVNLFQNNEDVKIFLISLKAGGLGLNLTAADYVFILDPWWNPAIEAQAVDRAYRIGQKNTVFTYKFITQGTVEEKILNLQKNKQKLASDLITTEESFVKNLSKEDITSIFD